MFNVIIIGGMAAGCKAAARLSRLSSDYNITIIERNPIVSIGNCGLPLFAAGEVNDIYDLAKTGYGAVRDEKYFKDVKNVNVLTSNEVIKINTDFCEVVCKNADNKEIILKYNALIIATGSRAVIPVFKIANSPFISSFHTAKDAQQFRDAAQKGKVKKAIVIGGGFIGCELTESLSSLWGIETILIEKEDSLLSKFLDPEISKLVQNRIEKNGVQVLLSAEVEKVKLDENNLPVTILKDGKKISADYLFYNLGVSPEVELAKKTGIKIGEIGGIVVDNCMRTNIPNIWAAGDCVETKNLISGKPDYFSLGSLSNRMGRVAANAIADKEDSFNGAVGSISLKIFDFIVSATGLSESKAKSLGYESGCVIGCWSDRPDYHPEAKDLFGKVIYEKKSLKLLGIQFAGEGEVNRYIDVFAELLANNKTIFDLLNVEHCYTPAHSSPISPLNFLGQMVLNQELDGVININPDQLSTFNGAFIDLREEEEIDASEFSYKSIKVPIDEIRKQVEKIDDNKPIMLVCEKGPRSLEAARFFMNKGRKNVSYLGGGNAFLKELNKNSLDKIINENINALS